MKLLFQNSQGEERVIANVDSFSEACEEIDKFIDERNFKSHYKRVWEQDGRLKFDVGSWTEFFFLEDCCLNDTRKHKEQESLD